MMRTLTPICSDGLVTVAEPLEGAFTLLMPAGWTNSAQLQREHGLNRIIASAIKPDKSTLIYLGDPRLPIFTEPSPYVDPSILQFAPQMRLQPYTPADRFFPDYIQQCFGRAPGFQITGMTPCPQMIRIATQRPGSVVTAAAITFRHVFNGTPMECRLYGASLGWQGMWSVDLATVSSSEPLEPHAELLLRMMTSRSFNPQWSANQQMLHEHRMAMGRQQIQHIQAMTDLQAQGHQQRMRDIQHAGEVNTRIHEGRMARSDSMMQSWQAQQTVSDTMQQSRINAVREEHTVAAADGVTYQVDSHHERYYVNKHDNTYIGTASGVSRQDLQRHYGVNPDDFEEVKIVR